MVAGYDAPKDGFDSQEKLADGRAHLSVLYLSGVLLKRKRTEAHNYSIEAKTPT